ncbi:MAG: hypothetical protein IJY46_08840, partial [Lentisphaeria bacterium]|nr:hypothetical protein [Lentisphaeria bacterium]
MTTLLLECDWHIGGKGETFFHEKKSRTSAPVFPSPRTTYPSSKKAVYLSLRLSRHSSQSDGGLSRLGKNKITSLLAKRALHVCCRQTLHIAEQC